MVEFPITGGTVRIDDQDYMRFILKNWYVQENGYAVRKEGNTTVYMHLEVFGPAPHDVDHRNLNKLDNQRGNLRAATRSQNMANVGLTKGNTSGLKGVSWASHANKWRARIRVHGKPYKHLGYFDSPAEAHEVYCLAADLLHGEFAHHG